MEALVKAYLERLKKAGLVEAEDVARIVIKETCALAREAAVVTENQILKFALPLVSTLEAPALRLVDKIDGKVEA